MIQDANEVLGVCMGRPCPNQTVFTPSAKERTCADINRSRRNDLTDAGLVQDLLEHHIEACPALPADLVATRLGGIALSN